MQSEIITDERYALTVIDPSAGQAAIEDASRFGLTISEDVMLVVQVSGMINQYFTSAGGSGNLINITATTDLGGHRVVTVHGEYADCSQVNQAFSVAGVTLQAVAQGASVQVQSAGEITESSWNWIIGQPVYLGGSGQLTQIPPTSGFVMVLGVPVNATTLLIDIQQPIILS